MRIENRRARSFSFKFALGFVAFAIAACATYRQDLNRGQRLYEENEYERALAIFRVLEEDTDSLSLNDQARYAYLRGMTGYRLGFRPDARHWLAIAKATEQQHPGGLSQPWKQLLDEALTDLNHDVYGGSGTLSRDQKASEATPSTKASKAPSATPPAEPASAEGKCTTSGDCKGTEVCSRGVCVPNVE